MRQKLEEVLKCFTCVVLLLDSSHLVHILSVNHFEFHLILTLLFAVSRHPSRLVAVCVFHDAVNNAVDHSSLSEFLP